MGIKNALKFRVKTLLKQLRHQDLTSMGFDITGGCNLNCKMCPTGEWYPKNKNKTIPFEIFERLSHVFPILGGVSLQCNCEPLLNKDIIRIIRFIKSKKPSIHLSFVTNGVLLTPELSRHLIESGLTRIGFSLDGATAEVYEQYRIGAKFETVIRNIRTLARMKKEMNSEFPLIDIITVSHQDNVSQLPDILNLAYELGAASHMVNGLDPYTKEMEDKALYGDSIQCEYEAIYAKTKALALEKGIQLRLPSLKFLPYKACQFESCVVDSNGDVFHCPLLSFKTEYYYKGRIQTHPALCFGNLMKQDFWSVWDSWRYRRFRRKLIFGRFPKYCKNCLLQNRVICALDD